MHFLMALCINNTMVFSGLDECLECHAQMKSSLSKEVMVFNGLNEYLECHAQMKFSLSKEVT